MKKCASRFLCSSARRPGKTCSRAAGWAGSCAGCSWTWSRGTPAQFRFFSFFKCFMFSRSTESRAHTVFVPSCAKSDGWAVRLAAKCWFFVFYEVFSYSTRLNGEFSSSCVSNTSDTCRRVLSDNFSHDRHSSQFGKSSWRYEQMNATILFASHESNQSQHSATPFHFPPVARSCRTKKFVDNQTLPKASFWIYIDTLLPRYAAKGSTATNNRDKGRTSLDSKHFIFLDSWKFRKNLQKSKNICKIGSKLWKNLLNSKIYRKYLYNSRKIQFAIVALDTAEKGLRLGEMKLAFIVSSHPGKVSSFISPRNLVSHTYHTACRSRALCSGWGHSCAQTPNPKPYTLQKWIIHPETLGGSFSAVSKPIFATKYSLRSIFRDPQDLQNFAPLQIKKMGKSRWKKEARMNQWMVQFEIVIFFDEFWLFIRQHMMNFVRLPWFIQSNCSKCQNLSRVS